MLQRKRGAQPGNRNAVKHGRHSRETREHRQAEAEARQERSRAWAARCPATDYAAICDQLDRGRSGSSAD